MGINLEWGAMKLWSRYCTPRAVTVAIVLSAAMLVASAVTAQEIKPLLDRMERLERDIRTLNIQISRGATSATVPAAAARALLPGNVTGPAIARFGVRLSDLETDLRAATGSMEELNHRINEINQRLDKLVSDVDYRLGTLETRAAQRQPAPTQPSVSAAPSPPGVRKVVPGADQSFAVAPQSLGTVAAEAVNVIAQGQTEDQKQQLAPAPQSAVAPLSQPANEVLPKGTAKEKYAYASGLLRQAQYDRAEIALKAFIDVHDNDPLASNARYWLGETYYVRSAYVQAAEVFLDGYQRDPKASKAPDMLLKLGMSLARLEKTREACAAFARLTADFPKVSAGIKNALARERKRNNCS